MSSTFGRVLLFRHLAICASALMAYVLRSELEVGYAVLSVVAASALLNFGLYVARTWPRLEPAAMLASPAIGVASWTCLIALTNGVASPFVAGLWLEVILSSMVFPPLGVALLSAASVAALVGQQVWLATPGRGFALGLEVAFLAAMGSLIYVVKLRSQGAEQDRERLGERLGHVEGQLEEERVLGKVGESAGRLAHSLKNSVHSLRGFLSLLEPSVSEQGQPALAGLRTAIDDLEALARLTLEQPVASVGDAPRSARSAFDVLERALDEVRGTHPDVRWAVRVESSMPRLPISDDDLLEVLLILLRNAIEAMEGKGEAAVEAATRGAAFHVWVRDEGPGLAADAIEKIFKAGFTTKDHGSGYGLFLARRVLAEKGALLRAEGREPKGASFEIVFPLEEDGAQGELP